MVRKCGPTSTGFFRRPGAGARVRHRLLHVLQDAEFTKLGSNKRIQVDVRVVAATNRNLKAAVAQLELAVKAGDGDFYQISVAESRLRAVRQELAEQDKNLGPGRAG